MRKKSAESAAEVSPNRTTCENQWHNALTSLPSPIQKQLVGDGSYKTSHHCVSEIYKSGDEKEMKNHATLVPSRRCVKLRVARYLWPEL